MSGAVSDYVRRVAFGPQDVLFGSMASRVRCRGCRLPDPRVAPAVLAVDRALAWYIDEVPFAQEQPLVSLAQAEHMREVLAGTRPRANEHFEILVDFARTMYQRRSTGSQFAAGQPG